MEEIMFKWLACLLVCFMASKTSCHLCLISPPQRGSMTGLNKPASDDCVLLKPPCGGRPAGKSSIILRAGQNFTVTFQKNLNHFLAASPGEFNILIGEEQSQKFQSLAVVKDMNEPDLHLYTVNVTIPNFKLKEHLVLLAVYNTKNPEAPPMFYQCSDVIIVDHIQRQEIINRIFLGYFRLPSYP